VAHADARLNRHGRQLLIDRAVVQHWPVAHPAKAMGTDRLQHYNTERAHSALAGLTPLERVSPT
jgi:hypothetical protein